MKYVINKLGNILPKFKELSNSKHFFEIKLSGEIELWHDFRVNKNETNSIEFSNTAFKKPISC